MSKPWMIWRALPDVSLSPNVSTWTCGLTSRSRSRADSIFGVPIALVPWAPARARAWTCLYLVAAATITLVVHYYPFDSVILEFGDEPPQTEVKVVRPSYGVGWVALLPVAAIGFLIGKAIRSRSRKTIESGS